MSEEARIPIPYVGAIVNTVFMERLPNGGVMLHNLAAAVTYVHPCNDLVNLAPWSPLGEAMRPIHGVPYDGEEDPEPSTWHWPETK